MFKSIELVVAGQFATMSLPAPLDEKILRFLFMQISVVKMWWNVTTIMTTIAHHKDDQSRI